MIEINMSHFYIQSRKFGLVAHIWVAEACDHWASDAQGETHSCTQEKCADNVALMKLLRTLKSKGLITADNTSDRLMQVVEEYDLHALWQSMRREPATEYNLGARWKSNRFRAKTITIDTEEDER